MSQARSTMPSVSYVMQRSWTAAPKTPTSVAHAVWISLKSTSPWRGRKVTRQRKGSVRCVSVRHADSAADGRRDHTPIKMKWSSRRQTARHIAARHASTLPAPCAMNHNDQIRRRSGQSTKWPSGHVPSAERKSRHRCKCVRCRSTRASFEEPSGEANRRC